MLLHTMEEHDWQCILFLDPRMKIHAEFKEEVKIEILLSFH